MSKQPSIAVKKDRFVINMIPSLMGLIVFICLIMTVKDSQPISKTLGLSICNTMIIVWIACLGFMITAIHILITIDKGRYIKMLVATGHYKTVLLSFMFCCFHIIITLAILIAIMFSQKWTVFSSAILCATTIDILILMGVCLFFLLNILIRKKD